MAVAVYPTIERAAQEVIIDMKSTTEVALVGSHTPGAVPVRIVGRGVRGVTAVRIVSSRFIVAGETIP